MTYYEDTRDDRLEYQRNYYRTKQASNPEIKARRLEYVRDYKRKQRAQVLLNRERDAILSILLPI